MKKIYLMIGILLIPIVSHAVSLGSQFRLWKSSFLPASNYAVMLTSAPIIFHVATGSPTYNAGTGYFSILESSNDFLGSGPDISTRAFYTLDGLGTNLGTVYDVPVTSHTFILKSGGGAINYLWDWLVPPSFKTSQDGN